MRATCSLVGRVHHPWLLNALTALKGACRPFQCWIVSHKAGRRTVIIDQLTLGADPMPAIQAAFLDIAGDQGFQGAARSFEIKARQGSAAHPRGESCHRFPFQVPWHSFGLAEAAKQDDHL